MSGGHLHWGAADQAPNPPKQICESRKARLADQKPGYRKLRFCRRGRDPVRDAVNGWAANLVMGLVVAVAVMLGGRGLWRAVAATIS